MQAVFYFIVFCFGFDLVSSDVEFHTPRVTSASSKIPTASILGNVPESNVSSVLEVYHKISEGAVKDLQNISIISEIDDLGWLLQDDEFGGNSTESLGVDANGCDRGMRKFLEEKCDEDYERTSIDAPYIEDDDERTEALCCALEDFEKCNLRAFDKANCGTDKAVIRENMKAARLFITVVANVTCSRFRGQCAYYSSAASVPASYTLGFGAVLIALVELFL